MGFLDKIKGDKVGLSSIIEKLKGEYKEGDIFVWLKGNVATEDVFVVKNLLSDAKGNAEMYLRLGDKENIYSVGKCRVTYENVMELVDSMEPAKEVVLLEYSNGSWDKIQMEKYWGTIEINLHKKGEIKEYI